MQALLKGNVTQNGKNVTINISPDMLQDTASVGTKIANNFSTADLVMTMNTALDGSKANKKKSDVEIFISKIETLCALLDESKKDNHGFYWEYYAPYFIDMHKKNQVKTFSYIAFASSNDPIVNKWLKTNKTEITKFYEWSNGYKWH